jgi:hypothetical protein
MLNSYVAPGFLEKQTILARQIPRPTIALPSMYKVEVKRVFFFTIEPGLLHIVEGAWSTKFFIAGAPPPPMMRGHHTRVRDVARSASRPAHVPSICNQLGKDGLTAFTSRSRIVLYLKSD